MLRKSFGILYGIQAASGMFRVQFLCKRVEKDLPLSAFREERKAGAQPEELIFLNKKKKEVNYPEWNFRIY